MCRVLRVHPSGFYRWLKQPFSTRAQQDIQLLARIRRFWLDSGGHYGYRNIAEDLRDSGLRCCKHRVLRLMQSVGLRAQRGYRVPHGYYGGAPASAAPNILQREFVATQPNQRWVSDMPYIHTKEGYLFLTVVLDLYARFVAGWSMSGRMKDDTVVNAVTMAYERRRPEAGLIFHSDQGSQYTSNNCRKVLASLNMEQSMSRRGNCWDNAVAESFFANLKREKIRRHVYPTIKEAKRDVFEYIELYYNPKRRHTYNGRVAPAEYERRYYESQAKCL